VSPSARSVDAESGGIDEHVDEMIGERLTSST